MALSATLKVVLNALQAGTLDLGGTQANVAPNIAQSFTDGAGAGQVDRMFSDTRTLAASASESLDLAGGSLLDAFGIAISFARVKAILIKPAAGNTNDVVLSRPASNGVPIFNAASDAINLKPGGVIVIMSPDATGYAVTAGTGDLITLTNSAGGTPVTYDIVILGSAT